MTVKSSFRLDPTSDRYRVCPYCQTPHMVIHRGRDFCSDKCADDYNNQRKKLAKQTLINEAPLPKPFEEPMETGLEIPIEDPYTENIEIMDNMAIDTINGTYYHIQDILNRGIDLNTNSGLYTLHNIPSSYKARFMQIGPYRLYRINTTIFLIAKR